MFTSREEGKWCYLGEVKDVIGLVILIHNHIVAVGKSVVIKKR